jgi:hypothetical protein
MIHMKCLFALLFISLSFSFAAAAFDECESYAIQVPAADLLKTLKVASESLYKDVTSLEVRFDGKGKLSIFYENGVPKLIKMTYINSSGLTFIAQKSFEEIQAGNPLAYENKVKTGKSIIVERGEVFKQGAKYNLNLRIRSGLNPDSYTSYPIQFNSDLSNPNLTSNGNEFSSIIFSPGVSMFSWDGTFKKVDFKN